MKYKVYCQETIRSSVIVEAQDEDEALLIAEGEDSVHLDWYEYDRDDFEITSVRKITS